MRAANDALTHAGQTLGPDAHPDVARDQESVQQAANNVASVTETAQQVNTEVTIYTTPDCGGCLATKRALDKAGVRTRRDQPDLSTPTSPRPSRTRA